MNWHDIDIAADGTHHCRDGTPLYAARFNEVLKFHAPGLAPVRLGAEAWHIDPVGAAAYPSRFERTFGFYDGRAAVVDHGEWHHVLPDGSSVYDARFRWCGNFQGGRCAVRDVAGEYFHIELDGAPAYVSRWRYAGDFKDGIAVVQASHGLSTHIDNHGALVHTGWYIDLDVFHKSFARARDGDGWMHVNRRGEPVYSRRFAMVEPFYNGFARVERFDGALEIIDESGVEVHLFREPRRSEFAALSGDMVGFWRTQTIAAAVELGIPEALPASASNVAQRLLLNEPRTLRLLNALGELHLTQKSGECWLLTARGQFLRRDHPQTLADAALEYARHFGDHWQRLPIAVRDKTTWRAPDIFSEVASNTDRAVSHHRMLASYATHDYQKLADSLPLAGVFNAIDAGGGVGVLAKLLLHRHAELNVVVMDRDEVIRHITPEGFAANRLRGVSADLLQPWGQKADAVILARVLHDWDDEAAIRILCHARAALHPGGRVFVVEMLLPENGHSGALCDLHLLCVTGGQERSAAAYSALLNATGFKVSDIIHTAALPSIIVGAAHE